MSSSVLASHHGGEINKSSKKSTIATATQRVAVFFNMKILLEKNIPEVI